MKPLTIASLLSIGLGVVTGLLGGIEWFVVPAVPLVFAAAMLGTSRKRAALIGAAVGFASVLIYIVVVYALSEGVDDRSAAIYCDEFCVSKTGHWQLLLWFSSLVAAAVALLSGLIAFFLAAPDQRASGAR